MLRNKFQWNFNQFSSIFIQENTLENVVCEMASILSQPLCVKLNPLEPNTTKQQVNRMRPEQNGHKFADNILKWKLIEWKILYFDYNSMLVQRIAWCHQAANHYPSQCLFPISDCISGIRQQAITYISVGQDPYGLIGLWFPSQRAINVESSSMLRHLNDLFKFLVLSLWQGNPPVTGGFPSQRASNVESISMPCADL